MADEEQARLREERLKAQLRANLRRRKARTRLLADRAREPDDDAEPPADDGSSRDG